MFLLKKLMKISYVYKFYKKLIINNGLYLKKKCNFAL